MNGGEDKPTASAALPASAPRESIGSRIYWFAVAASVLAITCFWGLRVLPAAKAAFAAYGDKLPIVTHVVFTFGPAVLMTIGVAAAVLVVMGEFTPNLRGVRFPVLFLSMGLVGASFAAIVFAPPLTCGEIINPSAASSLPPAQSTNAP